MKGGVVVLREGLLKLGFYAFTVLGIIFLLLGAILLALDGDWSTAGLALLMIPASLIANSMIYFPIKFVLSLTEGMIYPDKYPKESEGSDDDSSSTS
jgi:membrane-bound ClpP family serine protease